MNKEQFIDGLKDRGINDSNIFALVSNAFDEGSKWEREECAKFFTENDTNLFWGSQVASLIRERGQE